MKVAALYDVHAMPWAVEPVLDELDGVDAIVFGGDFVGGPYPRETLDLIRPLGATLIRGNAERAPDAFNAERLGPDADGLGALPMTATVDGVLYCHAGPTSDLERLSASSTPARVAEVFPGVTGTAVVGHTHHQFDLRTEQLRVVNAGAVGIPWEGDVAAYWALVEDGEPRHMRTEIDLERALREVRASGWPHAERYAERNLLAPRSRGEAIASIEGE